MKFGIALFTATVWFAASGVATQVSAASPKSFGLDHSQSLLIDTDSAQRLWNENLSPRARKLYPMNKFRFVSEVGGGFNDAKLCVVSARAMLMPVVRLPLQGQKVVYAPIKVATAFDAMPNFSSDQCKSLAADKLKEAIQSMNTALVAN